jgi:hypothetical protein
MRRWSLLVAAVVATALLGALVSIASAGRLQPSSQDWRAEFPSIDLTALFGTTRCAMTLEGSFHTRTIAKVLGALIGYITRAIVGSCSGGAKTVLTETLPWHEQYTGFAGTLPIISIEDVDIIGWSQRVRETGGITCLIRSTTGESVRLPLSREVGGVLTTARAAGSIRTSGECFGASLTMSGSSSRFAARSGARITLTLI